MKKERETITNIRESNDTHTVSVSTTHSETRQTLSFTFKDAIREKDNLMTKELGKAGLSAAAFVGATLQGIDQLVQGFNKGDITEIGKGAEIVILASFLFPLSARFLSEARMARREKIIIKDTEKSSKK